MLPLRTGDQRYGGSALRVGLRYLGLARANWHPISRNYGCSAPGWTMTISGIDFQEGSVYSSDFALFQTEAGMSARGCEIELSLCLFNWAGE